MGGGGSLRLRMVRRHCVPIWFRNLLLIKFPKISPILERTRRVIVYERERERERVSARRTRRARAELRTEKAVY